jgi:hypothetical protein
MDRQLLNQNDLLSGHLFLLQNPFQVSEASQCFRGLQRIDNQQDVMINDWLFSP